MSFLAPGPKLTLIKGAAWSLATRWGIRLVGFLNTVVMARLVLPEDYGIVAMAFLVVGLVQSLLDFSAATALIRKDKVSRDEIDSAWTLRGIQGVLMAGVMMLATPVAAFYFSDTRVTTILYVFSACVALSGFSNIGLTLAQKQFNFSLEFRYQLYSKLLSVFMTILAGWWFRDYRALVIGIACGYLGGALLSYWMHPYRPRWNTTEIKSIWLVTRWLMLANIAGFVLRKGDELVAARIGSTSEFGLYNVGSDLGQMPTGEVGPAVLKSFLPVLASMNETAADINATVLKTLRVVATLTLPLGFGLAAVASPATLLILGSAWTGAAPYVAAFAIVGAIYSLGGPVTTLLTLRGHTRSLSAAVWVEFCLFVVCAIVLVPYYGLMGLVMARAVGAVVNLFVTFWLGSKQCSLRLMPILASIVRPLSGALLMYSVVDALVGYLGLGIYSLAISILAGASLFFMWSLLSWNFLGRPEGFESTLLEIVSSRGHARK
ncbi:oligosaccharide flippase family protein [Hydrogenophaga sp.]|uniref:oligosaccharide flippase family protein n=1 Tax=Hydrogenophaga sp. TaxID=1904254 RepID=UPI00271C544B|nr:oligosaccharide flippase family protein [Hydrogenophaga sp.]MDO9504991.1 oligosaccharide flippase family protein [Hydrogenophaga sp.]